MSSFFSLSSHLKYRKGKEMYLPDTLSRAYLPDTPNPEITDQEPVSILDFPSITKDKYTESQEQTQRELNQLQTTILNDWPNVRQEVRASLRLYWDSRSELAVCDGIIYKGMRIAVPSRLRRQMLNLVHESHLSKMQTTCLWSVILASYELWHWGNC